MSLFVSRENVGNEIGLSVDDTVLASGAARAPPSRIYPGRPGAFGAVSADLGSIVQVIRYAPWHITLKAISRLSDSRLLAVERAGVSGVELDLGRLKTLQSTIVRQLQPVHVLDHFLLLGMKSNDCVSLLALIALWFKSLSSFGIDLRVPIFTSPAASNGEHDTRKVPAFSLSINHSDGTPMVVPIALECVPYISSQVLENMLFTAGNSIRHDLVSIHAHSHGYQFNAAAEAITSQTNWMRRAGVRQTVPKRYRRSNGFGSYYVFSFTQEQRVKMVMRGSDEFRSFFPTLDRETWAFLQGLELGNRLHGRFDSPVFRLWGHLKNATLLVFERGLFSDSHVEKIEAANLNVLVQKIEGARLGGSFSLPLEFFAGESYVDLSGNGMYAGDWTPNEWLEVIRLTAAAFKACVRRRGVTKMYVLVPLWVNPRLLAMIFNVCKVDVDVWCRLSGSLLNPCVMIQMMGPKEKDYIPFADCELDGLFYTLRATYCDGMPKLTAAARLLLADTKDGCAVTAGLSSYCDLVASGRIPFGGPEHGWHPTYDQQVIALLQAVPVPEPGY